MTILIEGTPKTYIYSKFERSNLNGSKNDYHHHQ